MSEKSNLIKIIIPLLLALVVTPLYADGVSGSAAGGSSQNADGQLESCSETLGTLAVHEDQNAAWWHTY